MGLSGSAHGRFQRAIDRGSVLQAEAAAHELGRLGLADALELVALYARCEPAKFDRASRRWLRRFVSEHDLDAPELQAAASVLALLGGDMHDEAVLLLRALVRRASRTLSAVRRGRGER